MRGFQDRTEVTDAVQLLCDRLVNLPLEPIELTSAAGRVLGKAVVATVAVPPFDRAAMDGYALRGCETFGSGPYNPLEFAVIGESLPGRPFAGTVQPGQAVRIMTGAPVPAGADAVLQAEAAEEVGGGKTLRVRVSDAVPPGRHVGKTGEDVPIGTCVLAVGRQLRPQDLGVLASIGANPVWVVRQPNVAIVVTGDELLPCGSRPHGYHIVDSNSVMWAARVKRDGGLAAEPHLIPDDPEQIRAAIVKSSADVLLISGGSSVGKEDYAPRILEEVGELVVHGVALRPASPAGFGFLAGRPPRPVFLLPGNPVSCLCAYDLFAGRAVRQLGGRSIDLPYRRLQLPLTRKIASAIGRVDYVRVQISDGHAEPLATSGAAILSSTTRADGFVLVPRDSEGQAAGETVEVHLYGL
jgi:molybdopterin molybdotransferase